MSVTTVNDSDFEEQVKNSDIPVLVDFWAGWCAPCKAIAPVLEDLSEEYADKIKIVKMDVTANQQTAADYAIRNIPALLVFNQGEKVDQMVGAHPRSQIAEFIENNT